MPDDLSPLYQEAGQAYGVDPKLLAIVGQTESSGNPNAVGPQTPYGQAQGVMQTIPATSQSLGITNPKDARQSIFGGAKLLAENLKRYQGDIPKALSAYHGGTDPKNWGPKTQAYVAKITNAYKDNSVSEQGNLSDQDLLNVLAGKAPAQTSASPLQSQNGDMSDDELMKMLGGGAKSAARGAQPVAPATPGRPMDAWNSFGAGLVNAGQRAVGSLDPAAQWLQQHSGIPENVQTLGGLLPTANQAHQNTVQDVQQFNQQAAGNVPAQLGLLSGEVAGAIPALTLGGEVAAGAKALPYVGEAASALQGSKIGRLVARTASGAAQGGLAGAATSGGSDDQLGDIQQGAELGGALSAGAKPLFDAGRGIITGLSQGGINPLRADLAKTAIDKYGIPLRWSQISSAPFAKLVDTMIGKLPLSGLSKQNAQQASAFTRGVASTFGEDADALTQDVMARAKERIGNALDDVAERTTLHPEAINKMADKFAQIENDASQVMQEGEFKPIKNQLNAVLSKVGPDGSISGETYQALTRKGSPLDVAMDSNNSNIREYAQQIRSALDDALQESATPEDLKALRTARLQWKNMRTVQNLAVKAGIEGEISPGGLLQAVKSKYTDMAYSGAGDLGDLANIGKEFLEESHSSNSAENLAILSTLRHGGGFGRAMLGLGGVAGAAEAPEAALGTLGGILAAGHLGGNILRSKLIRNAMLNSAGHSGQQAGTGIVNSPGLMALIRQAQPYGIPAGVIGLRNETAPQPVQ